jgi:hypothetical protein
MLGGKSGLDNREDGATTNNQTEQDRTTGLATNLASEGQKARLKQRALE